MPTADDRRPSEVDAEAILPVDITVAALEWSTDRVMELVSRLRPGGDAPTVSYADDASGDTPEYRRWITKSEEWDAARGHAATLPTHGPTISVLVPVYRPEPWYFRKCVESVLAQSYQDWELCLCDDGSRDDELTAMLGEFVATDRRISVSVHDKNGGISRATNTALGVATGQFVALLDHDDALVPTALAEMATAIEKWVDADVLYSDDDKMDRLDRRFQPHFKPDWSPDLLLSYPYLGHLLVVRRDLLERVGGFRPEYDGSQDYDVMFRVTEQARRVVHVPRILYHWRAVAGSAASAENAKPWAHDASRRVVGDTIRRRGLNAEIHDGPFPGAYHVRRAITAEPWVSIIIPYRDQATLTMQCLESLGVAPGYDRFDVVLVDNGSTESETRAIRDQLSGSPGLRFVDHPGPFNWSAINNHAVAESEGDLLLFMNNDIEATKPDWLRALVEHAVRPEVGPVGARLVFPDGTLQHGGVVLGISGVAGHVFTGLPPERMSYFGWDRVVRPYSAVTAACMACRREVFEEVGGFDEELRVAYNDVDFCLRAVDAGYRVLYTPHAELVHHESVSRGISGQTHDRLAFLAKWDRARLHDDPSYNPNLSLMAPWCPVRFPDEEERWQALMDEFSAPPPERFAPARRPSGGAPGGRA
jgi:GT2 family glycosyltransferase